MTKQAPTLVSTERDSHPRNPRHKERDVIELLNDPIVRQVLTDAFVQVCAALVLVSLVAGVGTIAMDQRARTRGRK